MSDTIKSMRESKRIEITKQLCALLEGAGEDVGFTASNEINFPIVLEDGTEDFIVVRVSIPTGSRDGDIYDGYGAREDYTMKCEAKALKAAKAAELKAKKIARDEKMRAQKAAAKAAREQA